MLKLVKKLNFTLIFWILFYSFVFGLLLRNSFSYLDPDLGWHLQVGQEISETKVVPHLNHYNYTYTGAWVDHEWLANLLLFEIYHNFGYIALSLIFASMILLSFILLNIISQKYFSKTPTFILAGLQLFGLVACLPHFGIRVQEFGFLFLLLELWIIDNYTQTKSINKLLLLLPLIYLWANLHGSFLFGLGLLFVWPVIKLLELYLAQSPWKKYINNSEFVALADIKKFALIAIGAGLLTLVTPYGAGLYSFLSGYGNSFYLLVIEEWLPQYNFPFNYWQLLYLALSMAVFGLFIRAAWKNKIIKADLWSLILFVLCLGLSFKSRRHFPLLFVASFIFLIKTIFTLLEIEKIKFAFKHWSFKLAIIICLFLMVIYQFINTSYISDPFSAYCGKYPCGAVNYLLRNNQTLVNLNIFNEYNWGGYLIWTYPERKLFIDGRLPQVAYAGHSFIEELLEFYKASADYKKKLAQYDIKLILLKTQDDKQRVKKWEKIIFWINENSLNSPNYLRQYLQGAREWKIIYQDSLATIYQKIN